MASSNGRDSSKVTASMDSLKLSSKNSSLISSKESILSKKDKECLQMQECKKKLLSNEQQIIIRDNNVLLKSPPQKNKIIMPPVIHPEELAASTPTQRNWRGILIALLVIAAVLGLIVFSIVLLTPAIDGQRQRGRRVNLAHMVAGKYVFKSFNGSWLSDEELVYRDRWGGLTLFNVKNLTTRLLMNNSTFRELNAVDFKVSPDLKFVLLVSDVRPGWRHGRLARYHVYDVINRNKITISPIEDDRTAPLLQYAEWSPVGSGLVFVHDNDIYYKPKVLKTLVCRITSSGVPGVIFNGIPDFLYETEILRLEKALWFSPDGQHLMYVTYNDTEVPELRYPWYGLNTPEPPAYPSVRSVRYPKMGANNPVVTLYVVSLKTPKFLFPYAIQFTTEGHDWYLRWSSWSSERQMVVMLLNRPQNVTVISICNLQHTCQDLTRTESSTHWSDVGAEPSDSECGWCGGSGVVGAGGRWFTSAGVNDPEGGRWRHAVEVTRGGLAPLTQGNFEITQVLGWDERRKFLYVVGTYGERAGERHLYRVEGDPPSPPRCLTCDPDPDMEEPTDTEQEMFENTTSSLSDWPTSTVLPHVTEENDTALQPCLYNRIYFSTNFTYYVQECLGPVAGWVRVVGRGAVWLGGGGAVRRRVDSLLTPIQRVFKVELQADRTARVRLLLPPGYKETDDLPLPLLLHTSSSPGEQLVTERWKIDWDWYMAATKNFIVAQIDASGSGGQGEELRADIYQKALMADVGDQIAVLSYLRDNLKMVDGGRVGVWGRGYGGGAALQLANEEPRNLTRCLAAVAPLADLTLYSSFWSERWCGSGSSGRGIASASAVWRGVGNIPPRRVLLAHATADLNVPPRHTLAIAKALQNANAVYNHQVYPDEGHEFERSSLHLYNTMEQFFDECFGPVELADWDLNGMGGLFPFRE